MKIIPLSPIPHQIVTVTVKDTALTITVRQIGSELYTTLRVNSQIVAENVRARAQGLICPFGRETNPCPIRWVDTQGMQDPQYEGLGDRWILVIEDE